MQQNVLARFKKIKLKELDRLDLRILSVLQENGRLSNKELAERVGLSASPCLVRVKRLEAAGLISRYMAVIDIRKLVESIVVISLFYLKDSDHKAARMLEDYLCALPQLCELYDVNGECDYIARFICRSTDDYAQIARALLDTPYQVRQIASYIVLKQLRSFSGVNLPHLLAERTTE
jgi:DNA-binding Lrp family transcriptional regulator